MIKHSEKQLEQVVDNISRIKAYSDNLKEVLSPDKTVFWKAIKSIIAKTRQGYADKMISVLSQKDLGHPTSAHLEVKFMAGAIHSLDEILSIVEKNEKLADEAAAEITFLKSKMEEIKNNIELQ